MGFNCSLTIADTGDVEVSGTAAGLTGQVLWRNGRALVPTPPPPRSESCAAVRRWLIAGDAFAHPALPLDANVQARSP